MHARINEILVISTPEELAAFEALLGDGSQWGCSFSYAVQTEPRGLADAFLVGEGFIAGDDVALILGDNIFYGFGLGEQLQRFTRPDGAVIFGLWVPDPQRYGVLEFAADGSVASIHEKPANPPSSYMVPGLYFYDNSVIDVAKGIEPSARGEIEITEVNNRYLEQRRLQVCRLPFSTDWFDVGTFDAMLDAQAWVAGLQRRKGLLIGSPEAAAYREGFIDEEQLLRLSEAEDAAKSGYGEALRRLPDFERGLH